MLADLKRVKGRRWRALKLAPRAKALVLLLWACGAFVILTWTVLDPEGWSAHKQTLLEAWKSPTLVPSPRPIEWCTNPGRDPAVLLGDLPGFIVVENVWFNNNTFYMFTPHPELFPEKDKVLSGPFGWEVHPQELREEMISANRTLCLDGNNLLLSDHPDWGRPGQHTGYWHYYHLFGEGFIGGVAALEAALEPISDVSRPELGESLWVEPYKNMTIGTRTKSEEFTWKTKPHRGVEFDRMVIPWSVEWRDGHGLNELLFKHLYGNNIVEAEEWDTWRVEGAWISLQRVVFADRWAAARYSAPVDGWNRHTLSTLSLPFSHLFLECTRSKLLKSLNVPALPRPAFGKTIGRVPKILYVDRQGSRRKLTDETHEALMHALRSFEREGKASIRHVQWEKLSKERQIEFCSDVDIYIGVHGNGMTHEMWMPPGGKVIEFLPVDNFTRDFQIIAESLGHEHFLIWEDRVVPQSEWDKGYAKPYDALWSGQPVPLDVGFISALLEELIVSMTPA